MQVEEKLLKLESHARRVNLKFSGITENKKETYKDCKLQILLILRMAGLNFHEKAIERAHRTGPTIKNRPTTITVRFFHAEDRELVIERAKLIREKSGVFVEEDFPDEIMTRRRTMKPIMTKAIAIKKPAKLVVDKLIINNKQYSINELHKLPTELQPETVFTPTNDNSTAFFTDTSPLSNHYMSLMKINGTTYNSNEQFYFHQKSLKFNDSETAKKSCPPQILLKLWLLVIISKM
jgi:hypothetical protein